MDNAAQSTNHKGSKMAAVLDAEMARDQQLIQMADNKAGILAGLLATILTLFSLAGAVLATQMKSTGITTLVNVTGLLAILALAGTLVGLAVVMWPRIKGLPQDADLDAYRARIDELASSPGPHIAQLSAGLRLQHMARLKHRGVQLALASLISMVTLAGLTFLLMVA